MGHMIWLDNEYRPTCIFVSIMAPSCIVYELNFVA